MRQTHINSICPLFWMLTNMFNRTLMEEIKYCWMYWRTGNTSREQSIHGGVFACRGLWDVLEIIFCLTRCFCSIIVLMIHLKQSHSYKEKQMHQAEFTQDFWFTTGDNMFWLVTLYYVKVMTLLQFLSSIFVKCQKSWKERVKDIEYVQWKMNRNCELFYLPTNCLHVNMFFKRHSVLFM